MRHLTTSEAAEILDAALAAPQGYWQSYLINNRRPGRTPGYRIPCEKWGGGVFYIENELKKFIAWEHQRRLKRSRYTGPVLKALEAIGVGHPDGSPDGRRLSYEVSVHLHSESARRFIRFVIGDPLAVFRLDLQEARTLVTDLARAIRQCEGASHV
jgi:hypothetical protein